MTMTMRTSTLAWVSKYSYYNVHTIHTIATTTMTTGTNAVVVHVHAPRRCMNTKNPIPIIRHHHTNKDEAEAAAASRRHHLPDHQQTPEWDRNRSMSDAAFGARRHRVVAVLVGFVGSVVVNKTTLCFRCIITNWSIRWGKLVCADQLLGATIVYIQHHEYDRCYESSYYGY